MTKLNKSKLCIIVVIAILMIEFVGMGELNVFADSAFSGCSSLSNLDLSNILSVIGEKAFYGCTSLNSVILATNITNISSDAFSGCGNLTIYTDRSYTSGWPSSNLSNIAILWGCELSEDNSYVVSFTKGSNSITNPNSLR